MQTTPELSEKEKEQYGSLIAALGSNELKLVRCRKLGTGTPVAALCIVSMLDSNEVLITPVARLITDEEQDYLVVEDRYRR